MKVILSVNKVTIRLTEERWFHITEEHSEMAGYYYDTLEAISSPDAIYAGKEGASIALKTLSTGKTIVVVYREISLKGGSNYGHFRDKQGIKHCPKPNRYTL